MPSQKNFLKKNRKALVRGFLVFILVFIVGAAFVGVKYYRYILMPNVDLHGEKSVYIYIPTGADFGKVKDILYSNNYIKDKLSFEWLAEKKAYTLKVKAGRYLIQDGMTNNSLINLLRSGKQEPLKLTFNNIRTKEQFISRVSRVIEADSLSLTNLLNDSAALAGKGFTADNVMCIFLPDTYEMFWNTDAGDFFEIMLREYNKFWNDERVSKASAAGLSPQQATVLASIVLQETRKKDEMSRVAGVYMNRLNKGMLLQADPTVIFATGDFTIKRVLKKHLEINSPYNTYKYTGLPPGPICLPDKDVIDKVLDYEKHDYLFFCAKEDFSGYHNFARNSAQHMENARRYQHALNQKNIKK